MYILQMTAPTYEQIAESRRKLGIPLDIIGDEHLKEKPKRDEVKMMKIARHEPSHTGRLVSLPVQTKKSIGLSKKLSKRAL